MRATCCPERPSGKRGSKTSDNGLDGRRPAQAIRAKNENLHRKNGKPYRFIAARYILTHWPRLTETAIGSAVFYAMGEFA
jgi:hypothetical protein